MVDQLGPHNDPGYLASLRTESMLGRLRRSFLALMAGPVVVLALSPFIIRIETHLLDTPPLWSAAVVPVVAAAALWLAVRVPVQGPPPIDPGRVSARASETFRGALFLRFALTDGVVLAGLPLSMASDSLLPMVMAFAFGYPLVLAVALPTRGTIERIRARMDPAGGEQLWAALLAPHEPRPVFD